MYKHLKVFFPVLLLLLTISPSIRAQECFDQNISFYPEWRISSVFNPELFLRAEYSILLNDFIQVQTGISFQTSGYLNAYLAGIQALNMFHTGISAVLQFHNRVYNEYHFGENSAVFYLRYETGGFKMELGPGFRFMNTNQNQLWNIFSLSGFQYNFDYHINFSYRWEIVPDFYTIEGSINSGDDFVQENILSPGLFLNQYLYPIQGLTVFIKLGARPSGSIAGSVYWDKYIIKSGVEYTL